MPASNGRPGGNFVSQAQAFLHWLLFDVRYRDLVIILLGVFGLLVLGYFFTTRQIDLWTVRTELERDNEERRQVEAWQRWEHETRQQLAQYGGTRSIGLSQTSENLASSFPQQPPWPSPRPLKLVMVALEVHSHPAGAEVFLDWTSKEKTPLRLEGENIAGLLVVLKDGHKAWLRRVSYQTDATLDINLSPEEAYPKTHLLLIPADGSYGHALAILARHLTEQGFTVFGQAQTEEFQQQLTKVGNRSHRAFLAWARARFNTNLLIITRFSQSIRDLGAQETGYPNLRPVLTNTLRVDAGIELELVDLYSGDPRAALSGKGVAFGLDRSQGAEQAVEHASVEVVKLLRETLEGK